jgi:hypothetical protein
MNADLRVQEYQVLSDVKAADVFNSMDIQLSNFEPLSLAA